MTNETALEFLKKLKSEKRILDFALQDKTQCKTACIVPFVNFEICKNAEVYTCCAVYINKNGIGNLKKNTLEEILHSSCAEEIRKKILNGDYSLCDTGICVQKREADVSMLSEKFINPKFISLSYDMECNLHCLYCRDKQYKNSKEQIDLYNKKIYEHLKPFLNTIEIISLSSTGEAFYSSHSRELIKKISTEYPKILWDIKTNGNLFNSAKCKELGIYGRINSVTISIHAIDKNLYNKIMRGSDYDTVIKNIKEAAYEYNYNKTIKNAGINAVISSLNYKELPKLAEFAGKLNVGLGVSQYRYFGGQFGRDISKVSVWEERHPEYKNFRQILKHPALDYDKISMPPRFRKIRET